MKDQPKSLEELKLTFASFDEQFKQLRAAMPEDKQNDHYNKIMDMCYNMVSSLRNYVYGAEDKIHSRMDKHMENHPPHPKNATQMQKYLKMMGAENDYDVQKPTIYVSATRNGSKDYIVEFSKKCK